MLRSTSSQSSFAANTAVPSLLLIGPDRSSRTSRRHSVGSVKRQPILQYTPPDVPPGKINTTDPDSRNVKAPRGYMQGYNAQAVTTDRQIVIAAELNADSPDFGHLEPMVTAAARELQAAGVHKAPGVVVADSGYGHQDELERIVVRGIPVPSHPTPANAPAPGRAGTAAALAALQHPAGGLIGRIAAPEPPRRPPPTASASHRVSAGTLTGLLNSLDEEHQPGKSAWTVQLVEFGEVDRVAWTIAGAFHHT